VKTIFVLARSLSQYQAYVRELQTAPVAWRTWLLVNVDQLRGLRDHTVELHILSGAQHSGSPWFVENAMHMAEANGVPVVPVGWLERLYMCVPPVNRGGVL
jgi:hypothetical protein